jgi:hypothetical protein
LKEFGWAYDCRRNLRENLLFLMGQTTLFEDKTSTQDRISPGKVGSKDVAGVDLWKLRFFGEKFESTNGPGGRRCKS